MAEKVMVKPIKTFDMFDGHGVRLAGGDAFEVSKSTAAELMSNGLIEMEKAPEEAPAPKRKGRANENE